MSRSQRPLAYWDCGFESRRRHGCLSVVSAVCCQVEVSARSWSLVQRSPTECGVSKVWSWSLEKWGGLGPQGAVEQLEKKRNKWTKNHFIITIRLMTPYQMQVSISATCRYRSASHRYTSWPWPWHCERRSVWQSCAVLQVAVNAASWCEGLGVEPQPGPRLSWVSIRGFPQSFRANGWTSLCLVLWVLGSNILSKTDYCFVDYLRHTRVTIEVLTAVTENYCCLLECNAL